MISTPRLSAIGFVLLPSTFSAPPGTSSAVVAASLSSPFVRKATAAPQVSCPFHPAVSGTPPPSIAAYLLATRSLTSGLTPATSINLACARSVIFRAGVFTSLGSA